MERQARGQRARGGGRRAQRNVSSRSRCRTSVRIFMQARQWSLAGTRGARPADVETRTKVADCVLGCAMRRHTAMALNGLRRSRCAPSTRRGRHPQVAVDKRRGANGVRERSASRAACCERAISNAHVGLLAVADRQELDLQVVAAARGHRVVCGPSCSRDLSAAGRAPSTSAAPRFATNVPRRARKAQLRGEEERGLQPPGWSGPGLPECAFAVRLRVVSRARVSLRVRSPLAFRLRSASPPSQRVSRPSS